MEGALKRIFIVGNASKPGCKDVLRDIGRKLRGRAHLVGTSMEKSLTLPEVPIDLVISLGGDGSFLNLVSKVLERDIPIMGINFGRLGFLTAGLANEFEKLLDAYFEGETFTYERMVLTVEMEVHGERVTRHALNDVLVSATDLSRVAALQVGVADEPLFQFRGDGIIISTPTGSTAHSLSAGGSLVDPQVEAILITPLSSQSMSSRPLIVRPHASIEVGVGLEGQTPHVYYDGRHLGSVTPGCSVRIYRHNRRIKMVQPGGFKFLSRLADKLGWSETLT